MLALEAAAERNDYQYVERHAKALGLDFIVAKEEHMEILKWLLSSGIGINDVDI